MKLIILQADTNNGVSEYPNDPTMFNTAASEIEFLEPELFYSMLNSLDDNEEIFSQIDKKQDKEIYNKIKSEYGIR